MAGREVAVGSKHKKSDKEHAGELLASPLPEVPEEARSLEAEQQLVGELWLPLQRSVAGAYTFDPSVGGHRVADLTQAEHVEIYNRLVEDPAFKDLSLRRYFDAFGEVERSSAEISSPVFPASGHRKSKLGEATHQDTPAQQPGPSTPGFQKGALDAARIKRHTTAGTPWNMPLPGAFVQSPISAATARIPAMDVAERRGKGSLAKIKLEKGGSSGEEEERSAVESDVEETGRGGRSRLAERSERARAKRVREEALGPEAEGAESGRQKVRLSIVPEHAIMSDLEHKKDFRSGEDRIVRKFVVFFREEVATEVRGDTYDSRLQDAFKAVRSVLHREAEAREASVAKGDGPEDAPVKMDKPDTRAPEADAPPRTEDVPSQREAPVPAGSSKKERKERRSSSARMGPSRKEPEPSSPLSEKKRRRSDEQEEQEPAVVESASKSGVRKAARRTSGDEEEQKGKSSRVLRSGPKRKERSPKKGSKERRRHHHRAS